LWGTWPFSAALPAAYSTITTRTVLTPICSSRSQPVRFNPWPSFVPNLESKQNALV
jgi:hypothetical protein